ncbi:MAG TPA: T9SS type A sorting domain-containing protein [Saprospiraceae bacterium]|nr:T9SS type A sorting domain-containing protein [Saprospiraceae bacterium]
MKRKEFLRGLGIAGAGSVLIQSVATSAHTMKKSTVPPNACTLIPSETAGPFPLDLTDNNFYFRQDVREDRTGTEHHVMMRIIGTDNCGPMANVRVNIWHCDRIGNYSGYGTEVGKTYLRGYQITDSNGEVEFITIFPGWYNGRIAHIHFQVFVSSVYAAISQFTYPIAEKNAIYAENPTIYTKGADPLSFNQDGVFADGYALQLTTLTPNTDTGGNDSFLEVSIEGTGTTGLRDIEPETGGQFKLFANNPNPFSSVTTIPFTLNNAAHVKIELYDLNGKKVLELINARMTSGAHNVVLNRGTNGITLSPGSYAYKITTENSNGVFRQAKLLTLV